MSEPRSATSSTDRTLTDAVLAPHEQLAGRLAEARAAGSAAGDPRAQAAPADIFLALASAHLAAAEEVLLPAVRRHLPDGRSLAALQLHRARELERLLRDVEGSLYGDMFVRSEARGALWTEVERLLGEHGRAERRLVEALAATLGEDEQQRLGAAFTAAVERAPTRPHPYSPHSARFGKMSNRLWSVADRAMDTMDNRSVPHRPTRPHRPADSRWGQYVLGQPTFDEAAEAPAPEPAEPEAPPSDVPPARQA